MSNISTIEWTNATWNPVTGCTKVGAGCDNCYAEKFAERWRGVKGHAYENGFDLQLRPERLELPLKWRKPRMVFVCSMGDPFHKDVPDAFIDKIFDTMEAADHHIFQLLTKRSSRMRDFAKDRYGDALCPSHIWLGVSVENRQVLSRLRHLQATPASVRMVSFEPLLEDLGEIDLTGIHWGISGGESGPGWRPMDADWARSLRDQCIDQGVAFFFKQWSGFRAKPLGRLLDGREWNELPQVPGLKLPKL